MTIIVVPRQFSTSLSVLKHACMMRIAFAEERDRQPYPYDCAVIREDVNNVTGKFNVKRLCVSLLDSCFTRNVKPMHAFTATLHLPCTACAYCATSSRIMLLGEDMSPRACF